MQEMWTVVVDVRGTCKSVCQLRVFTHLHCVKAAEWIKVLFALEILGDPRHDVHGVQIN